MRLKLLILCLLTGLNTFAQEDTLRLDSTVLRLGDFLNIVLDNHPVVRQAQIVNETAQAELLTARGGFDPKVSIDYDLKNFEKKEYYDLFNATLKVPTAIGIEPKITVDRNEGLFLNDQIEIPSDNNFEQVAAGLSIPIGRGMFIDERRATLAQAKIYQDIAEADQNKMLNKILVTAAKDYWNWYLSYSEAIFLTRGIEIATEIYDRVEIDYGFGEAAVVDTIQAKIVLQERQAEYAKVLFELENARLLLALHLWSPDGLPLELKASTIPDTSAYSFDIPTDSDVKGLVDWAMINHPEILKTTNKINQLEVENRFNKEMLKPQVDLSYMFIDAPFSLRDESNNLSFSDNYKLGVAFSFPLLLRKERGKIQKTNLKIQSNSLELSNQKLDIRNGILRKYAEVKMSQTLTVQYRGMTDNYKRLVDAESFNLELGESDLFKLNAQFEKYISSQIKYLENLVKLQKNKVEILYESGTLFLNY